MQLLRTGQDVVLSWSSGASDCHVVAAAGSYVLLRPERPAKLLDGVPGPCSLTFLQGMIPVGFDGFVEFGSNSGELRFKVGEAGVAADRRTAVRLPILADAEVTADDRTYSVQLLDVSAGGLRYRGPVRSMNGDTVRVRAALPGGPTIEADALVRFSEIGGVVAVEYVEFHAGSPQEIGAWTVAKLRQSLGHG